MCSSNLKLGLGQENQLDAGITCRPSRTLVNNVIKHLLFAHALSGCDTTPRLHGIGKPKVLKNAANSLYFRQQVAVFKLTSYLENDMIDRYWWLCHGLPTVDSQKVEEDWIWTVKEN